MNITKFIEMAACIFITVLVIAGAFLLKNQGVITFQSATEQVSDLSGEINKYDYLDGTIVNGKELKEYYKETKSKLKWNIATKATLERNEFFNEINSTTMTTSDYYVNEEGEFACTLTKVNGVATEVTAIQQ